MPQVIAILRAGIFARPTRGELAIALNTDHLSLSAAGHAGDALWRHAQRDASLLQRRGGADLPHLSMMATLALAVLFPGPDTAAWGVLMQASSNSCCSP